MKLRLDLVLCIVLIATAGTQLVAPDALSAEYADQTCQADDAVTDGATRAEAEERILAQGYSEVRILAKGGDNAWHALAFAEGDPVNVVVTPQGTVLTE
jgi:hypothetical protein